MGEEVRSHDLAGPATFWITNPNNTFIGNVAAGSESKGFWFVPVSEPLRNPGTWGSYNPRKLPVKEFRDNTGHSNAQFNLGIDNDVVIEDNHSIKTDLHYSPVDENGDPVPTVFEGFTGYKGKSFNVWTRMSGENFFRHCSLAESREQAFVSFNGAVEDSLLVGMTRNVGTVDPGNPVQVQFGRTFPGSTGRDDFLGAQVYNGSNDFRRVHLAGFSGSLASAVGTRRSSGKHPNATTTGITFESDVADNEKIKFFGTGLEDPARTYIHCTGIIDLDGSLTGQAGIRITPHIQRPQTSDFTRDRVYDPDFNVDPGALVAGLLPAWNARGTIGVDYGIVMIECGWGFIEPEVDFLHIVRSDGQAVFDLLRSGRDLHHSVIIDDPDFRYSYQFHEPAHEIRPHFYGVPQGSQVMVAFENLPSGTLVETAPGRFTEVFSMTALESAVTNSFFRADNTIQLLGIRFYC